MANGDAGDMGAANYVRDKILSIYRDIHFNRFTQQRDFAAGRIEPRMRNFAKENNIELSSQHFYMGAKSLTHTRRATKQRDEVDVSIEAIAEFPRKRPRMDLYWDGDAFIYTDSINKFILKPNYIIKQRGGKIKRVNFITAMRVLNLGEFNLPKYKKV